MMEMQGIQASVEAEVSAVELLLSLSQVEVRPMAGMKLVMQEGFGTISYAEDLTPVRTESRSAIAAVGLRGAQLVVSGELTGDMSGDMEVSLPRERGNILVVRQSQLYCARVALSQRFGRPMMLASARSTVEALAHDLTGSEAGAVGLGYDAVVAVSHVFRDRNRNVREVSFATPRSSARTLLVPQE